MEARSQNPPMTAGQESARERILAAAAHLYAVHGYQGTSIRQIAGAAGVTKPLIFYHFESKERLFSSLLRESIDTCRTADQEIFARRIPVREKLRELLRSHIALAATKPAAYAFAYETLTMPGLLPLGFDYKTEGHEIFLDIVRLVEEGRANGELRDIDPDAVAVVILASVGLYVSAVLSGDIERIPDHLEETLFDLIMHGLEEVRG